MHVCFKNPGIVRIGAFLFLFFDNSNLSEWFATLLDLKKIEQKPRQTYLVIVPGLKSARG